MEPIQLTYDISRCFLNDYRDEVCPALFRKIDGLHRSRNLAGLASCSCHFDWAKHTISDWRFLRQVEAFFKKNASFAQPDVCFSNAQTAFIESESSCEKTNWDLKPFIGYPRLMSEDIREKVTKMTRYIDSVLGDLQPFIEVLPTLVKVTSGATSTHSRRDSLPQLKMRMKVFCTRRASPFLKSLYRFYGFNELRVEAVHSNRVELVPKNWKTDRTIACEPEGNIPLQLAFDTYAKRRLRRFGIDLSDQTANQRAAKHASIHDDLVTVDFSKASDTISYNTVSLVFPVDWFNFLDKVRTPCYRGVFGDGMYHKFSSMGNGSTFCIETLLFAAACYACGSKKFLVYGDDVVIEREFYDDFISLTRFLGFSINLEKSFSNGPFRESCGKDYFKGTDVTPVYIRGIDRRKASLCHLINTMRTLCFPGSQLGNLLINLIDKYKLPLAPSSENTLSGIHISARRAVRLGILKTKHQIQYYKSYTAKYKRRNFVDSRGYYLWFLFKNEQVLFKGPWALNQTYQKFDNGLQTSSVAVFDHAYVRKRVGYHPDGTHEPPYWWINSIAPL